MARVRVEVNSYFKTHLADLESAVKGGLAVAGKNAATRSQNVTTKYNIGDITGTIKASSVYPTRKGYGVSIYATDFREIFFELGTYKRRRKKLKKERRSTSTQGGVKPGYFLRKGLRGADEVIDATRNILR